MPALPLESSYLNTTAGRDHGLIISQTDKLDVLLQQARARLVSEQRFALFMIGLSVLIFVVVWRRERGE